MALALGTENKRNVIIAGVLFALLIGLGIWQFGNFFGGPSAPPVVPPPPPPRAGGGGPNVGGGEARKLTNEGIDPTLHFEKLAQSEDVRYEGSGRNIFSAESAPIIPNPIAPARANGPKPTPLPTGPPPPPPPPAIELTYFGYSQNGDKSLQAFFLHGDDIFMARSGEIVDRRYKVGTIRPMSVDVTDLAYNHTQTLTLVAF